MSPRARCLIAAGLPAVTAALIAACGGTPSRTSPTPSSVPTSATSPTPIPTPAIVGSSRTVLSPLGLRIHSAPALGSTNVVGNFGQGAFFTVLDYQSGGGGWMKVQGRSTTGWIVADPALTAPGSFNRYAEANGFSALYPQTWAFQQESYGTVFLPQQGMQSVLLETGATPGSFGPRGLAGYSQSSTGPVQVCGYTGTLTYYVKAASFTGATPTALPVPRLPLYAEIRVTLNASNAVLIAFNYQDAGQLDVFSDVYNSLAFPFPLCEAPAAPTPTPGR
ncbi:MAG TPA: hypothetical protein VMU65_15270 [Candidatus Saccharimonadales bacterium]|nr:hypothetical protein [Candidatus Saccharimonadales bacterium]